MKILLDTSTLVAAMVEAHPAYERAFPWLQRVHAKEHLGLIAAHSLAELYSVLTTLPVSPPVSPATAQQLIEHNILSVFEIVALSGEDYQAVLAHLTNMELIGGIIYDTLILYAAIKADAEKVITLNAKDFRRIYPDFADKVMIP